MNKSALASLLDRVRSRVFYPVSGASRYLVGDAGDVISLVGTMPRVRRPAMAGKYLGLHLKHDDGVTRSRYLHQIVLEAFGGLRPDGFQAAHLDGNRFNNDFSNLAWTSARENHHHKRLHGTSPDGERNPMAKLTIDAVKQMRAAREEGATYRAIAEQFGVSTMTAHRAINGETWK